MARTPEPACKGAPSENLKGWGASRQVEEAIKALEQGDFDIAVTLAGAAAEGMLKRSGQDMCPSC
jgi:hypothetical protein